MKIRCEVEEVELDGDYGTVAGVRAICSRCDHEVEAFRTSDASIRSCLVRMREECPRGQSNFYTAEGAEYD